MPNRASNLTVTVLLRFRRRFSDLEVIIITLKAFAVSACSSFHKSILYNAGQHLALDEMLIGLSAI